MSRTPLHELPADAFYEVIYLDATKLLAAFIFNIYIPTIARINGPGLHTEFAPRCDATFCAAHSEFCDPHVRYNVVPCDGQADVPGGDGMETRRVLPLRGRQDSRAAGEGD